MSIARRRKREADRGFAKLGDLCAAFYHFLGKKPQPTDEEVRSEFIRLRSIWVDFANKHNYDKATKEAFTRQVAIVWNSQKREIPTTTENETPQSSQNDMNSGTNT